MVAAVVALVAAGCGGGSSGNGGGSGGGGGAYGGGSGGGSAGSGGGGTAAGSATAAISAKPNGDLGQTVLVNSKGYTLYLFEKDESDGSYCNGACAQVWPAVTTKGEPQAGGAVDASKLSTVKREDGATQVTYAGHPLYTYVKDAKPGQATGNEVDSFGAEWYALQPNGEKAEAGESGGSSSGKAESGGGGSGYGGKSSDDSSY
jgi:predicted lipoprotein with Yx(FWY)xxD motif